jgi:lysyl-tRNA synthetase class I
MDRIELITTVLTGIFNKNNHDFYDVDMFCDDVRKVQWKRIFSIDSEFLVDFNCACMAFCHQDKHFELAGQVIVFSELSDWACEVFNV